jgi:hypothetical protein
MHLVSKMLMMRRSLLEGQQDVVGGRSGDKAVDPLLALNISQENTKEPSGSS